MTRSPVTGRRAMLAAVGTSASALAVGTASAPATATLRVRVVPAATGDRWNGWDRPALEAYAAIGVALERLTAHIERESKTIDDADWSLDAEPGVDPPTGLDGSDLLTAFGDLLDDREARSANTAHLLLAREPFNPDLGYGTARADVTRGGDGTVTIANLGATERWDGRDVTRNIAIHEVLHTLVDDEAVGAVVEGSCDHDLGSVTRVDEDVSEVTPFATAYAGAAEPGSETSWHGTGCGDHDRFYRHDGITEEWRHTTELSAGTLGAVRDFAERRL
ncbi:hypothetical protein [Natranaeroarchaeum sulfidigenes]|nr:hypothetical protein [Natranaeroarchaeum sulfidigenes]